MIVNIFCKEENRRVRVLAREREKREFASSHAIVVYEQICIHCNHAFFGKFCVKKDKDKKGTILK